MDKEAELEELLSEEEICELHEAFNIFDTKSDGSIETNKLGLLMSALKQDMREEELAKIIKKFDTDNLGIIYFNQFLQIMAGKIKNTQEDEEEFLKNVFNTLDRNGNGLISIHEIRYIVTHSNESLTENDIALIAHEADTDGDGLISFEEFMSIMKT